MMGWELFDRGHGDVTSVVAGQQGLALEVEEEEGGGHAEGRRGPQWARSLRGSSVCRVAINR